MLDLETLGTAPGSIILSIGAVSFDIEEGLGAEFYAAVAIEDCRNAGLRSEPATEQWWARQSPEAKEAAFSGTRFELGTALAAFDAFWFGTEASFIWCHGANFDAPMLEAAYAAIAWKAPWHYWNVRCTRTLYALADIKPDRTTGTHHNALDDAKAQALAAIAAMRVLSIGSSPA